MPEPFAPEGGHEEVAFPLRNGPIDHDLRPARGGLGGRPDSNGIDIPLILAPLAFDLGLAVVRSGLDPVDLVPHVLPELARVQLPVGVPGQTLHVAVAVGVDGVAGERVVRRDRAVRLYAQDLASERVPVLGVPGSPRVARTYVEHAVWSELDPTPIVIRVDRDAREYGLGLLARPEPDHAVVPLGRVIGIDVVILLVIGRDGDAEQPALARPSLGQGLDLPDFTGGIHSEEPTRVAFRNEGVTIGQERERPGHFQVRGESADFDPLRGSLAGFGGVRCFLSGIDRLWFAATVPAFPAGLAASRAQENEQDRKQRAPAKRRYCWR